MEGGREKERNVKGGRGKEKGREKIKRKGGKNK